MFFGSAIRKKSKEVQKRLKRVVEKTGIPVLHITAIGYKYDSVFWICVDTDAQKAALWADQTLLARLEAVFEETGYLQMVEAAWEKDINDIRLNYLKKPTFTFESQETVDRDFHGNWYHAMK